MPLTGGAANKLGSRYEAYWTVRQLLRVLTGEAGEIRIEPPGVDKMEFWLSVEDTHEFHQAKRRHTEGAWTLTRLRDTGLLDAVFRRLKGGADTFVFVSSSDAPQLRDLSEAACDAASQEEFKREFLKAESRRTPFEQLLEIWRCDSSTARGLLKRTKVRTIDECTLREELRPRVRLLFPDDTRRVVDALFSIVADSVHKSVGRGSLLRCLARRELSLRPSAAPETATELIHAATDRYLQGARRKLILGRVLSRKQSRDIVDQLKRSGEACQCAITGKAGMGKSACVVDIIERLRELEMPVLALRMDHLSDVVTMPASASYLEFSKELPALTLHAAARGANAPAVLVVDQFDAVSTASGRTADSFDLVERLLRDVRSLPAVPPVHTVIVCREFDLANDSGLRSIIAQSARAVTVEEFSTAELESILGEAGWSSDDLRRRQRDLLRVPQNLARFLDIVGDDSPQPSFLTEKELFDQYWKVKQIAVERRPGVRRGQWMAVMEALCDEMTNTQRLVVAREHMDSDEIDRAYVAALESEGVLIRDRGTISFAHESLLDYVFARLFVRKDTTLATFLRNAGQDLFRRAQVRQTLTYLRGGVRVRYVEQLRELLGDRQVRVHIKDLVLGWLAEVPDPLDGEWEAWKELVAPVLTAYERGEQGTHQLARLAWQRLLTSTEWLAYLDSHGLVDRWLSWKRPELVNELIPAMTRDQRRFGQRLGMLLSEKREETGRSIHIRGQIVMAGGDMSRETFEGLLQYVDSATPDDLDERRDVPGTLQTFWHVVGKHRPEWMVELIAATLRCAARVPTEEGVGLAGPNLLGVGTQEGDVVEEAAAAAPQTFAELVLPLVLELSDSAAADDEPPRRDKIWPYLTSGEHLTARSAIVGALADAVSKWASKGSVPGAILDDLGQRDTQIGNRMLLALYRGGARHYWKEAIETLVEEPWRFECGTQDSPQWFAGETVGALVECASSDEMQRLEDTIMDYVPAWERDPYGYRSRGRAEFDLLSSIPDGRRSRRVLKRIGELERKFQAPSGEPRGVRTRSVVSPIAPQAADKMTDEQWLRAIRKYQGHGSRFDKGDELVGGAHELSRELERRTTEDPERFGRLASRLPSDADPAYLSGVLRGLERAECAVADDLRLTVCAKAFADTREDLNVGCAIADVLQGIAALTDEAVEILSWLATEHPHPDSEGAPDWAIWPRGNDIDGIYTFGINTTRGRAAEAVARLIVRDAENLKRFEPAIQAMLREQNLGVVACVGGLIAAVGAHDAERGIRLTSGVECVDAVVLATPHFLTFLASQLPERFEGVRGLVERMIRSDSADAQEAGARLAGLAVLYDQDADDLVAESMQGSVDHRRGIAQVASRNVTASICRDWCERHLAVLFDDQDEAVRRRAATCFQEFEDRGLDGYEELIKTFVESRAFLLGTHDILGALERARTRLPGVTCLVCERFLDHFGESVRDISTRAAGEARDVATLVFRTYQQHQGDEWGGKALDLIDRLCLTQAYGTHERFEEFER